VLIFELNNIVLYDTPKEPLILVVTIRTIGQQWNSQ